MLSSRLVGRHGRVLPLALTCLTLGISACGSNDHTNGGSPSADTGLTFSDCMRAHGVPNFPDALPGGGYNMPSTIDEQAPAYIEAHKQCASLEPGPIPPPKPTQRQTHLDLTFSRCVRAHGLPNFPDPTRNLPAPGALQGFIRGGFYWQVTAGTVSAPAFLKAANACGWQISRGVRSGSGP
jgi:hypothetical protein